MSVEEILNELHSLPRSIKFRLLQTLVTDLEEEDAVNVPVEQRSYPVWSPHDSFEAAEKLLHVLKQEGQ